MATNDWSKGWMNTFMVCPNNCGTERGYTANDAKLFGRCLICGTEMEGFRLIKASA
jgi:hypothetical protein